jgi:hypothetical protein
VIDYISKRSAGDYGYLTHKGNSKDCSGRCVRSSTRTIDRKINDLAFADDIALLENDHSRAQKQLDALKLEASNVGLEINVKKTEQMRLNVPTNSSPIPPLYINNEPIEIVNEFKYLGSYMGSTDKDINSRIALAWAAFAKLKPILTSRTGKPSKALKLQLFNAACISILLYGCETWVISEKQANKLDIFARTCYRIILGIKQSETHMTNEQLYKEANAKPISLTIRDRQLQFTGHCLRMPADEPSNILALYPTSSTSACSREGPYVTQIAKYICAFKKSDQLNATEITKYAKDKAEWFKIIGAPHKPD